MKYCNPAEKITFEVKLDVKRENALVCFRNFFIGETDLDFGETETAKRSLDCSVEASDEEILKSVFDDVTGAWGLMLESSARQSEDPVAKEMFQEASNYLDVLDFDKLNKKLFLI